LLPQMEGSIVFAR